MKMRYKIIIEYFGKNYNGWQRQQNGVGVQQVIEDKLSQLLDQPIKIAGSGRTDTGVHALGQTAHFDADTNIPPDKLVFAANAFLPPDIQIKHCEEVPDGFHSQYGAIAKTYRYQAYVSRTASPLRDDHYAQIIPPIDIDAMRACAGKLVGTYDFAAFSSAGCQKMSTVRTIYRCDITQHQDEIIFEIEGNGFLYNMVRIIVGTLVYVGKGKLDAEAIDIMLATGNRKAGGKTYPAKGLYLESVKYT